MAEAQVIARLALIADAEWCAEISGRDLAAAVNLRHRSVVLALASLRAAGVISSELGSGVHPSRHVLLFLLGASGAKNAPVGPSQVELFSLHSGAKIAPLGPATGAKNAPLPNGESGTSGDRSKERAGARSIEFSSEKERIFDRIATARIGAFPVADVELARTWLADYARKCGWRSRPAPDDVILARFLAVGPMDKLLELLQWMLGQYLHERKAAFRCGDTDAWFVTLALHRVAGFSPMEQRELWARLARRVRPADVDQLAKSKAMFAGALRKAGA